jgi:hypothetical protein
MPHHSGSAGRPAPLRFRWEDAVCDAESLSAVAKHAASALRRYMNGAGTCRPSVGLLARRMSRDRRTVQRALDELAADGWIDVDRGGGAGRTSTYYATFPTGETAATRRPSGSGPEVETAAAVRERAAAVHEKGGDTPPEPSSEPLTTGESSGEGEDLDHVVGGGTGEPVVDLVLEARARRLAVREPRSPDFRHEEAPDGSRATAEVVWPDTSGMTPEEAILADLDALVAAGEARWVVVPPREVRL